MNDQEFGRELRRFRPAGPPEHLRKRIIVASSRGNWMWLRIAAAIVLIVLFRALAAVEMRALSGEVSPAAARERQMVDDLARVLGGDVFAYREALAVIERSRALEGR